MSRRETEPTPWRRSARCESGSCAEVKRDGDGVLIRSSLAPEAMIRLTDDEWQVFRAGVAAGDFDD
jgi:Domain of unknown function (DUF397)